MPLLVFEFIGTTELAIIALVALIIFGPRKLPELGRTLGKSLGEFKRASEDFKRTWEREVEVERTLKEARIDNAILTDTVTEPVIDTPTPALSPPSPVVEESGANAEESPATIPRTTASAANAGHSAGHNASAAPAPDTGVAAAAATTTTTTEPGGKQDWL